MSFVALGWASRIRTTRSSDKLLLLALADCHSEEHGLAWPSVAWLSDFSCLDRKTVIAGLQRLEEAGHIIDSGKRVGKTRQIACWILCIPNNPVIPTKSTDIPTKESQKRDTDTIKEPIKEPSDARATLSEDWKPGTLLSAKLDKEYPNVDIGEQVTAFILYSNAKGTMIRNPDAAFEAWMNRIATLRLPVKARASAAGGPSADPAAVARSLTDSVKFYTRLGRHEDAAESATRLVTAYNLAGDDSMARKAMMLAIDQWKTAKNNDRAKQLELWAINQWGKEWRKIDGPSEGQDDKGPGHAAATADRTGG
jgi:hypothetical protein